MSLLIGRSWPKRDAIQRIETVKTDRNFFITIVFKCMTAKLQILLVLATTSPFLSHQDSRFLQKTNVLLFGAAAGVGAAPLPLPRSSLTTSAQGLPFEVTGREMYGFGNRGLYGYPPADKEGTKVTPYKILS